MDADAAAYGDVVKQWYDGYHFGNYDIYCPWDLLNYIRDLQDNPKARPASYWKNTSFVECVISYVISDKSERERL